MHAPDFDHIEGIDSDQRPTMPAPPCESGVQLSTALARRDGDGEWPVAMVDVVVCDLSRDPRSEDYAPERASNVSVFRRRSPRARRLYLPTDLDLYGT
jgi:hypothetical protein